jgi:hypothetical protein
MKQKDAPQDRFTWIQEKAPSSIRRTDSTSTKTKRAGSLNNNPADRSDLCRREANLKGADIELAEMTADRFNAAE